ncbi:MAG: TetR/AcrR family transcriptional regulator [Verrucomicrobia bacterium]|nr:TetR/AcrR family transcriptional regulator [Verrucomicrobiota bacterium]
MSRRETSLKARPLQARSVDTLRRLLDATERLLAERHFEEITLHEIMELSGVSTGSFYARFHSKEDLLPHLYTEHSDGLRARMAADTDPARWRGVALAARIRALVTSPVRSYRARRGLLRAVALLARARPAAVAHSALRERDDQYRAAAALLLECRAEIRHAAPDLAVPAGLFFVLAACRDKILFAEAPHPASVKLTDDQLAAELAHALHAYLTVPPPASP